MHIRPKTKRRLLIIFAVMGAAVGLLLAVYAFSQHRNTVAMRKLRGEAMAAYRAGDFDKSVKLFQDYFDKTQEPDAEAQFAYGKSRINVPMPGDKQLNEGINIFKQYLDTTKPGDAAAQHELLKLYVMARWDVEAEHLADEMLAKSPRDGEVLWQKVFALVGDHHPDEALKTCLKLNEIEPGNLNAQLETIDLMGQNHSTAEQIIAHATALHNAHDQDPHFEVLLADAYAIARQDTEKVKWLKVAASRKPPDAQFVLAMVSSLDNGELYSEAADFLARAADAIPDPLVQRLHAQRLWQEGKLADLENQLKSLDPASHASDGMLLGYRALALYADNKKPEAATLADAMSHRSDVAATAWAIALAANYGPATLSPTDRMTKFQEAVIRDPQNPVLRVMLAREYLQAGEAELVVPQCYQASQFAPSWAMPYIIKTRALLDSDRARDALVAAEEACKRASGTLGAETAFAQARFALATETGLAADYSAMLPHLEKIQKSWHDPQMLGIYVTVLARSGKTEQAVSVLQNALKSDPPLPMAVLTNLADVAASEHLNVGSSILDFAEKVDGLTPEIAYTRAKALVHDGKETEAGQFLANAEKGHETEMPWRIVMATFHEMSGSADAVKDWVALGDQYPTDLRLQQTILQAQSRQKDRAFWERTVERVKALTGEQAILWRVERGRWLLSGDLSERERAEAVNLLTQVTTAAPGLAEPHRLLALAMQKVANVPGAIAELTAAADANPGDPAITRALVELLIANNRAREAQTYLDKLAQKPRLTDEVREWLVSMYVQQEANDKALAVLADDKGPISDPAHHDLMLAQLYRRVGNDAQAARLYMGMLDKPVADPVSCVEAADFFAGRQEMTTAEKFLVKLDALSLKPGELEVDRAEFAERWIGVEEAFKRFQTAIQIAPQSGIVWGRLACFHLRHERFTDAASAAESGLKAAPDSASLKALHSAATALSSLDSGQDLQALIDAITRNPEDPAATEMLGAMAAAHAAKLSPADSAARLRGVSDRHADNVALQSQTVRAYLLAGQTAAALDLARHAATAFPRNPEPQRLLADIYVTTGEWSKAEQAALLWREHSMGHPMGADIALATIYLRQPKRDPAGAVRVLTPHVSPAAPLQNPVATELYARALVMVDRARDAAAMLKPLLAESPHWRRVWLDLATSHSDAKAASDWIGQVADLIPADAAKEHAELADAWYSVGVQFDSPPAIDKADQTIQSLLQNGDNASRTWMLAAQIAHAKGDYTAAEKGYRQVLKIDPQSVEAMNDLAYVLWLGGKDENLPEAMSLATSAITGRPNDAGFYDTLARIQARSGDRKSANQSFRAALQRDPNSLEAMIGLADLLSREPSTRDQARELLAQIQRQLETASHLSAVLRQQYQTARDAVASSL